MPKALVLPEVPDIAGVQVKILDRFEPHRLS